MNDLDPHSSKSVLDWPRQISRQKRTPLTTGHRSFLQLRSGDYRELFSEQQIRVSDHALVLPVQGELQVGTGMACPSFGPGEAVLISRTETMITELPCPNTREGHFLWYFFNDTVLGQAAPTTYKFLEMFHRAATHPADDHIIPLRNVFLHPQIFQKDGLVGSLKPLLTVSLNSYSSPFLKLFTTRIAIPRVRVHLFLERLILQPRKKHQALLSAFAGGIPALRREMRRLAMPSVADFVTSRRREVAQRWREQGASDADILKAFHMKEPGRVLPHVNGTQPDNDTKQYVEVKTEVDSDVGWKDEESASEYITRGFFTFPRYRADSHSIPNIPAEFPKQFEVSQAQKESAPERSACQDREVDFSDTGILEFLPTKPGSIPGLEDWEELLKAA